MNSEISLGKIDSGETFQRSTIADLVRQEFYNIMDEMQISDHYVCRNDIDEIVEKYVGVKAQVPTSQDDEISSKSDDAHMHLSVFHSAHHIKTLSDSDRDKLIVENFQILEHRISNLEERILGVQDLLSSQNDEGKVGVDADFIRQEVHRQMKIYLERQKLAKAGADELGTFRKELPKREAVAKDNKREISFKEIKRETADEETKRESASRECKREISFKETKRETGGKESKREISFKETKRETACKDSKRETVGKDSKRETARQDIKREIAGRETKGETARKERKSETVSKDTKRETASKEHKREIPINNIKRLTVNKVLLKDAENIARRKAKAKLKMEQHYPAERRHEAAPVPRFAVQKESAHTPEEKRQLCPYEMLYYERRQRDYNTEIYKKSSTTVALNFKPLAGPYLKPEDVAIYQYPSKRMQVPMFLVEDF